MPKFYGKYIVILLRDRIFSYKEYIPLGLLMYFPWFSSGIFMYNLVYFEFFRSVDLTTQVVY